MTAAAGREFSFEIVRHSTAPASTLFALESDGACWSQWAGPLIQHSTWVRRADPGPAGLGAIRQVGLWPLLLREETVGYEPDRCHRYRLVGPPAPMHDYHGELRYAPAADGGTEVRWRCWFTEAVPGSGPLLRAALRTTIGLIAGRLIAAAERRTSPV